MKNHAVAWLITILRILNIVIKEALVYFNKEYPSQKLE